MRKLLGWVVAGVGMFLLVASLMAHFWAPSAAERTPLNVDSTTHLTGEAQKLNPVSGKVEDLPVKVTNLTGVDPKKSDDKVVVFLSKTCVVVDRNDPPDCVDADDPEGRLVTASTDAFAADRHTGLLVNDSKYVNDGTERSGLANKWPFNTQKKDYQVWDDMLQQAVPVTYVKETKIDGLKVYEFSEKVAPTAADVVEGVEGKYSTEITYFIEPVTGSIVNQIQHQRRELADGSTILDMSIKYTDQTLATNVQDGKDNSKLLKLLRGPLWLVGVLLGLIGLAVGVFLVRRDEQSAQPRRPARSAT